MTMERWIKFRIPQNLKQKQDINPEVVTLRHSVQHDVIVHPNT